jgi:hypothetical protein
MTVQDLRAIVEGTVYLLKNAKHDSQTSACVHRLVVIRDRILKQNVKKTRVDPLLEDIDNALESFTKVSKNVQEDPIDMSSTWFAFLLFFAGFYSYSMVAWFGK